MNEVLKNIWGGLAGASALDQANLVLGITGVWLMIRRSLWAFPVGLLAVAVQGVLFFRISFMRMRLSRFSFSRRSLGAGGIGCGRRNATGASRPQRRRRSYRWEH